MILLGNKFQICVQKYSSLFKICLKHFSLLQTDERVLKEEFEEGISALV